MIRRFILAASLALAPVAHAQVVVDTTRGADSVGSPIQRPPLSSARAFLGSLVLPGYSQSMLGRHRSGAIFLAFEAASIFMIRETTLGIREARRNAADSVVVSYVDGTGAAVSRKERTTFPSGLVTVRREQREDWIAVLVATHLFAGLDALVASQLWDLPAEVSVSGTPRSAGLKFKLSF
jgi:hypothetical protein